MNEKEEMKAYLVKELALMLIENNKDLSIEEALTTLFNSETYEKVMSDATKLYYQSPGYVFSFLNNELKTGKMA
jgi:hypothetical protein